MISSSARIALLMLLVSVTLAPPRSASAAPDEKQLGNWFNDPFLQVRHAVPDCPEPVGPRITKEDATKQEHYRVERGTSCFQAGECSKPNAYLYDAPIAAEVEKLFGADPALARDSSLWITVSRRFVYIEGCRGSSTDIDQVEARVKAVADVQMVLVNVAQDPHAHLPYQPFIGPEK